MTVSTHDLFLFLMKCLFPTSAHWEDLEATTIQQQERVLVPRYLPRSLQKMQKIEEHAKHCNEDATS